MLSKLPGAALMFYTTGLEDAESHSFSHDFRAFLSSQSSFAEELSADRHAFGLFAAFLYQLLTRMMTDHRRVVYLTLKSNAYPFLSSPTVGLTFSTSEILSTTGDGDLVEEQITAGCDRVLLLETTSAVDISPYAQCPHEREHLVLPGMFITDIAFCFHPSFH
jgi:hypothetical protein